MRRVVVTENQSPYPGIFFNAGCFRSGLYVIPVLIMDDAVGPTVAMAKEFQRNEATGDISYDIQPFRGYDDDLLNLFSFVVYAKHLIEHMKDGVRIIERAAIYGIYLQPISAIPKDFSQKSPVL